MNLKKNDILTVEIEDLGSEGNGIAKVDGYAIFVKDAFAGDLCDIRMTKVNKNFGYARLEKIIEPSADRVTPACSVSNRCGGCQLQSLSYEKQLEFKTSKVKNNIERIGGISDYEMLPIIGMENPYRYRNKTQFPVGKNRDGETVYGFYAGRTHAIICSDDCVLSPEINMRIMDTIVEFMKEYGIKPYDEESGKGLVRHVLIRNSYLTNDSMVCIIINGKTIPEADKLVERLVSRHGVKEISLNENRVKNNVIMGDKITVLKGKGYLLDGIGDLKFQINPKSFFQVNPVQTKKLYDAAVAFADIKEGDIVWDLYCGIGTMTLAFAQKAKLVYGVEIVPEAIDDARENAKLNNISNAKFFVGAAEDIVAEKYGKEGGLDRADVVVLDPPRKGCDTSLLETIAAMAPERVVYVSCDSATLARDLKILEEKGYKVEKVQPVDMFGQTVHVETVCLMSRKEK